ncbi:hypothetical protein BJ322DRAFT_1110594 [Thelephora terrestris]|uniref:Uncharacterized protein n=1 Tax=Thelephora terrestris TaxID=56493 RepID=A0A9P6HAE9_9AGAM|nr:hypothetical protein BJ322DRAFT_1110594 [Thelephora terrestris]
MAKKPNTAGYAVRRSAHHTETTTKECIPDDPGERSRSVTPVLSGSSSPSFRDEPQKYAELGQADSMEEEDEFMPTVQEVAKTLTAMRSRQPNENPAHQVGFARFGTSVESFSLNIQQQGTGGQASRTTGTEVNKPVSPLFAFPTGNNVLSETYLSEDVTWSRFVKRESNLKDADLASGWRIDLQVLNKVERIRDEDDEDEDEPSNKKKGKAKAKKKSKKKLSAVKQKRGVPKKSCKKAKRARDPDLTPSAGSKTSESDVNDTSDSETTDDSEEAIIERIRRENNCARCNAPCTLLTNSDHHRYSMEELSLWATMIVRSSSNIEAVMFLTYAYITRIMVNGKVADVRQRRYLRESIKITLESRSPQILQVNQSSHPKAGDPPPLIPTMFIRPTHL